MIPKPIEDFKIPDTGDIPDINIPDIDIPDEPDFPVYPL